MGQSLINPEVLDRVSELADEFRHAKPFRHVVIDNFLHHDVAEAMLDDFPSVSDPSTLLNEFGAPNPKSAISDVRSLARVFVEVDRYIQSDSFLKAMSEITGIPDLRYDPWYFGAGTHENFHGAGLDPHYDFNFHPKTRQHRRVNAIIYLNKDWDPAWKGDIAFHSNAWDLRNDTTKSVTPEFNRCVIFETTEKSWHSVRPVQLPEDKRHLSRKSFTIYLYSEDRPAEETAPDHGTVYVQTGLPDRIREGRTLTAEDMAEIEGNLQRRQEYLQAMYKREYEFSRTAASLREEVARLKLDQLKSQRSGQVVSKGRWAALLKPRKAKRLPGATVLFDKAWLEKECPAAAAISLRQYFRDPRFHRVNPHPLFAAADYLEHNPDVAEAGVSPLQHYLEYGWFEGRNPHPAFANDWYLAQNPDVLSAGANPLEHYLEHGWKEGRRPNPSFDPEAYLARHPAVRAAGVEPLTHFVASARGAKRGSSGD